jgi:putative transposase
MGSWSARRSGAALVADPVRWSRPREGMPQTVTSWRAADGWSGGGGCAAGPRPPLPPAGPATGTDRGLDACAPPAAGTRLCPPGGSRPAARKRPTAPRRVSRRTQGSARRRQAVPRLARAPLPVQRHRADCPHTTARRLVQTNDTLSPAEGPTATRLTHHHRAQSRAAAGGSPCVSLRAATAADAGRRVVAVPPAAPSQTCSGGGGVVRPGVSVRWPACPDGGTATTRRQRDHTAAQTIESLGQRLRGGVALAASEHRASPGFSRGECQGFRLRTAH